MADDYYQYAPLPETPERSALMKLWDARPWQNHQPSYIPEMIALGLLGGRGVAPRGTAMPGPAGASAGVGAELAQAQALFQQKFGHPPAQSIANDAQALMRWYKSPFKNGPAEPGVGYGAEGAPFPETVQAQKQGAVERWTGRKYSGGPWE